MIRSQKKLRRHHKASWKNSKLKHSNDIRHELAEASFTEDVLPINVHKLTPFFPKSNTKDTLMQDGLSIDKFKSKER